MSSLQTPFTDSEDCAHTTDYTAVKPSPSYNVSQVKEEVPLNGDHIVDIMDDNSTPQMKILNEIPLTGDHIIAIVDSNSTPQTGNFTKYDSNMSEEYEDSLILEKMKGVGIGVVTVGTGGNFAFLQVGEKTIHNHLLKCVHFASNLFFGVSSLIAAIVVLIIYIISPKSSRSIKKLKYALRVAILLGIIGYVLAVVFILQQG